MTAHDRPTRDLGVRGTVHISSALVSAMPAKAPAVARAIGALPGTEVAHVENGKIIVVLEGGTTGEIGSRLAAISLMPDVLSASMVFEQIADRDTLDEEATGA